MRPLNPIAGSTLALIAIPLLFASADTLVPDADFDAGVSAWSAFSNIDLSWDPLSDYLADPSSGAAKVTNTASVHSSSGIAHCVEWIPTGHPLEFSAWAMIPGDNTAPGSVHVFLWWRTTTSCGGSQTLGPASSHHTDSMPWTLLTAPTVVPPDGTRSAQVYLAVNKTSVTAGEYTAYFDHVDLQVPNSVFIDGFELGTTGRWSSATTS